MRQNVPKVSIIVAAYNAQKTLKRCLNSCIQQSYSNFEVIAVDDGSTDATPKILEVYAHSDSRIKAHSIQNRGQGFARNRAFEHASGQYVTILDADDELCITALEELVDAASKNVSDITVGEWMTIRSGTQKPYYASIFKGKSYALITALDKSKIIGNTHYSIGKLYRLAFLKENEIRYGEGYIYEDMEFCMGAVLNAKRISVISKHLYIVHSAHDTSTKLYTDTDWHMTSFLRALSATTARYGSQLIPYRKSFSAYVLNRTHLYSVRQRRVPQNLWRPFIMDVMTLIDQTFPFPATPSQLGRKYSIIVNAWRINKMLGYLAFRAVIFAAKHPAVRSLTAKSR